jgi:hypothetical protein
MSELSPIILEADRGPEVRESKEGSKETIIAAKDFIAEHPDFDVNMMPLIDDPERENTYATFAGDLSRLEDKNNPNSQRKRIYLIWEKGAETVGPIKVTTNPSRYADEIRDLS